MNEFYLILVVILFALAISNIVVGVSNDAIYFLKSATGSKSSPKWMIYGIAAVGMLLGATISNGMMGIVREGIFNPESFSLHEVMVIFMSVMVTNVLLLNFFNRFGYSTSSSVSLIFELLGSAVAVSFTKINKLGEAASELDKYICSERILLMIGGLLVSVFIAFIIGAILQWITRFLFSFRYHNSIQKYGAIYGGICITFITFFILSSGIKGSSILSYEASCFFESHMFMLMLSLFAICTLILYILKLIFSIDILQIIVLFGTFGLAMSFAGNDLVNFIGVPLAGLTSFNVWNGSAIAPSNFNMGILSGAIKIPQYILLIAGAIMTVTLLTSKKAQKDIKTSNFLSMHSDDSNELYGGSWPLSRFLFRISECSNHAIAKIIPNSAMQYITKQFKNESNDEITYDKPDFDMLRAVTILMTSSMIISIGTILKMPLSTTYVTFMVAMGASLADKTWSRESAVYRISGVFSVVSGWFLTALITFSVAFIIAKILIWGRLVALIVLTLLTFFIVICTHTQLFRKKKNKASVIEEEEEDEYQTSGKVLEKCNKNTVKSIIWTSKAYFLCFEGFFNNNRQQLNNAMQEINEFNAKAKELKDTVYKDVQELKQDSIDSGHFYVQVVGYQRELAHSIHYVVKPMYEYLEEKHKPFTEDQNEELSTFSVEMNNLFNYALHILKENKYENIDELIEKRNILVDKLKTIEKSQIKRIKANDVSTKNSILFFNIISETKMLLLNLINLVKSQRDFNQEGKTKP